MGITKKILVFPLKPERFVWSWKQGPAGTLYGFVSKRRLDDAGGAETHGEEDQSEAPQRS
jgi:hypothetical protein